MKRSEIIERLQSVQEDLEVLIDHADEVGDDPEGNIPTNSVFFMPFTDVIRMIKAGLFDLFRVGDQIVNQHSKYGRLYGILSARTSILPLKLKIPLRFRCTTFCRARFLTTKNRKNTNTVTRITRRLRFVNS